MHFRQASLTLDVGHSTDIRHKSVGRQRQILQQLNICVTCSSVPDMSYSSRNKSLLVAFN